MRLKILGCHGGESPSHRTTSFMIDERLVLDAGSITRGLSVPEQNRIDYVFLSHSHLDHIRDLAMLADNVIGQRKKPVEYYCTDATADALEKHLFNNVLWPDFTKIPNPSDPDNPTVRINRFQSGDTIELDRYEVSTVKVDHPVDCHSLSVKGQGGTLTYSGDTGPTDALWEKVNQIDDLKILIIEVSFPNAMLQLAKVSGHLTPELLAKELEKLKPKTNPEILIYGMKPGFHEVLKGQLVDLGDSRLTMLKPMDEFEF